MKLQNFRGEYFKYSLFAAIVLLLSFFPRFKDILLFLPNYYFDERALVQPAVGFLSGDIRLYGQTYYGPFYIYFLSALFWVQSLFYGGYSYFENFFSDPAPYYYSARCFASVLNIALGFSTFFLATKIFSKKKAFIVLLLAIFPFFDLTTAFHERVLWFNPRTDSLMALLAVWAVYFAYHYARSGKVGCLLWMSAFIGMQMAIKPLVGVLLTPLILFACMTRSVNQEKPLFSFLKEAAFFRASVMTICVFFLCHPHALFEIELFLRQQLWVLTREGGRGYLPGWQIYRFFGVWGVLFTSVAFLGLIYHIVLAIRKRQIESLLWLGYPLIFWLAFSRGSARTYWYITILPFLILAAGSLLSDISEVLSSRLKRSVHIFNFALICILLAQPSLLLVQRSFAAMTVDPLSDHTAFAGKAWIEKHVPSGSSIFMYGKYKNLPRIIDQDPEKQVGIARHYARENAYLKNLFFKSHTKHKVDGDAVYDIEVDGARLSSETPNAAELRRRVDDLLKHRQFDYLISNYDLSFHSRLKKLRVKTFSRDQYSYGEPFDIYRLKTE